jgi:polar amino acid transport system substrate-binding protein
MKDIFFYKYPKSKLVKVYVTKNWPPFDIYSNNRLKGIGIDFWKLIAKKVNIDYVFVPMDKWLDVVKAIKENVADVTPNTSETPDRKKFAYFSKPYVAFPLGILCNKKYDFGKISDIKTIAVGKNFTAEKLMKLHYKHIKYVETQNTSEALRAVEEGKAQCVVDILPSLLWYLKKENMQDMVLEFKTPFKFNLQVMVSKENKGLVKKINKAISQITPQEKKDIVSKYSNVIIVEQKRHNFNYLILFAYSFVFFVLVYMFVRLKKHSEIDALTKIYNRGALEKEINRVLKETGGSLLFFDLDKFKAINDTYGHEKGDMVLKKFSDIIKNNIRKHDVFGRWGGEEFILVLPEADLEDGMKKAEDLRRLVEETDFDGIRVTVSIGVTKFKKGEVLADIVKRADNNLYRAKHLGRNQVIGG